MFLTSRPELLNALQWAQKQADWLSDKGVVECTTSKTMLDLKVLVEDTCSQITCDRKTREVIVSALMKVAYLGRREEGIE